MAGDVPESRIALVMEDQASPAANTAANSLQDLRDKITGGTDSLRAMEANLRRLKMSANPSAEAIHDLKDKIAAQRATLGKAAEELHNMKGAYDPLPAASLKAASATATMNAAVREVSPQLAGVGDKVGGLVAKFGVMGTAMVAIAAAAVALGAGLIAAIGAMSRYAVACADAHAKQMLMFEAMTRSAKGAGQLQAVIDDVSSQVSISSDEVSGLAKNLWMSGLRGDALRNSLARAALEASGLGLRAKLGSDLARRSMLPLDVQVRKARENLARLFRDTEVSVFERALQPVLGLLSESTATGKALKSIIADMMNPLFKATAALSPVVKRFFQGMVIGALLLQIQLLQVRNWFLDTFGDDVFNKIDLTTTAIWAGVAAIGVMAALLGVLGVAAATGFALVYAPVALGVAALYTLGSVVMWVYDQFEWAYDELAKLNWGDIGNNIIDSIDDAIFAGIGSVVNAVAALGTAMKDKLKSILGIHSPSKVFFQLGGFTAQGFAQGIESGAPQINAAVGNMAQQSIPVTSGFSAPALGFSAPSSPTAGGNTYNITVNVEGGKEAQETADAIEGKLANLLERIGATVGAPVLEPAT